MIQEADNAPKRSAVEEIKEDSKYLRGSILDELADESTGGYSDASHQIGKFHGTYLQDDRDQRRERRKQKLERAFIFMLRIRVPGGVCTPDQWQKIDSLADSHANGTIKLTTRQAFQLHGILKHNLKPTIAGVNKALLDTIAACGDVNRNVMCNPNPDESAVHGEVHKLARAISDHLTPRTHAYHEIWLDGEKVAGGEEEEEPIYGRTYLPRKFKTVIAVPPSNDVDIFAHDLGYIAIVEDGKVVGYNVTVGGGMGMDHNKPETYPQTARILGFCSPEQAVDVAEKVVTTQRDFGDRINRKHARLKYTIDDRGIDWFRGEVESRLGYKLEEARPFEFTSNGDRYGWKETVNGNWNFTLFILSGRVRDDETVKLKSALKEIAEMHDGEFRLTANQNLVIANVPTEKKDTVTEILTKHGVDAENRQSGLRHSAMSCVALPTCGLALAESERMLPDLVSEVENIFIENGLRDDEVTLRVTGCPNGCARPYLAEIGFVGKVPGKYNIYLGAAHNGSRLNKLWKISVKQDDIPAELTPVIQQYARERQDGEHFGDFVVRAGIIAETTDGRNFHEGVPEK